MSEETTDLGERLAATAQRAAERGIDIGRMRLDWLEHHVVPPDKRDEYELGFLETAEHFLDNIEEKPKLSVVQDIPKQVAGQLTFDQ